MGAFVSGLAVTPVKSTRIGRVQRIELDKFGASGDRAFCVIDERGRMVNGKVFAKLMTVISSHDAGTGRLMLTFPGGERAEGVVRLGETLPISFFSMPCDAELLVGPWADALSDYIGARVRIVRPQTGVDRGREGGISLISRASLKHLAEIAETDSVDARRFRMLIEVDGIHRYEEDSWIGREVEIGDARVAIRGNVGRCAITTRDPESAKVDFPTLELLAGYRRNLRSTEPLPFGVYGEVLEPGAVSVGDPVTARDASAAEDAVARA